MGLIDDMMSFLGFSSTTETQTEQTQSEPIILGGGDLPLTGTLIRDTYPALIKMDDNAPLMGVLRSLTDGLGNPLPVEVSNSTFKFTGNVDLSTANVTGVVTDTNYLSISLIDFTNNNIYYYGGENSDLEWQINKWDENATKQFANITNNPTYNTLNDAWVDKLTLNYN
jgi:hypothetical protein